MSDFTVNVGGDFTELLNGFKQLSTEAKTVGDKIENELGGAFGKPKQDIDSLIKEINRLKTIQAKLSVDAKEYENAQKQIEALSKELDDLKGSKVSLDIDEKSTQSIGLLSGAVAGISAALTDMAVNAIGNAAGAVQNLVTDFGKLDTEIRKASAASGEAGAYDRLSAAIDKVGIDAAGTQQEVAALATELVRGGLTVDQVEKSLGAIVRGAEATGTSFDSMGSVVSAALVTFGLDASKATDVVDTLVTGANASATSAEGMGNAFKLAGPVAKLLGVDVGELGTAVGLLANAGIDASEAGTTLRNGLSKLGAAAPGASEALKGLGGQSADAAKAVQDLGLDIYNTDGTLKPMRTTLLEIKDAFSGLSKADQLKLAAKLFGGEDDGAKWLALLDQSEENINKMADAMDNAGGAADKARGQMAGWEMAVNQLTGTLGSIGNTIGGVAAAALLPIVNAFNSIAGAVAGLPTGIKQFTAALVLAGGAATAALVGLTALKLAFDAAAVKSFALAIGQTAIALQGTLISGITAASTAIPPLLVQLNALGATSVGTAIASLGTALKTTLYNGILAATSAFVKFTLAVLAFDFAKIGTAISTFAGTWGGLTLATAATAAAIGTFVYILGQANNVSNTYKPTQEAMNDVIAKMGDSFKQSGDKADESKTKVKNWFQMGREELAQLRAMQEFETLQGKITDVQMAAKGFYDSIKSITTATQEQVTEGKNFITSLQTTSDLAGKAEQSLRAQAQAAKDAGDPNLANDLLKQANVLKQEQETTDKLVEALSKKLGLSKEDVAKLQEYQSKADIAKQEADALKEQVAAKEQIARYDAAAPERDTSAQLAVANQLLTLTQQISAAEQSRFDIIRSGLNFELQKMQEKGFSEEAMAAKRKEIEAVDKAALSARYVALQAEQTLQTAILALQQKKALIDADLTIYDLRNEKLAKEKELQTETNDKVKEKIGAQIELIDRQIAGAQQQKNLLTELEPLQNAVAAAQGEIARNALQSEARMKGYKIAADGSLVAVDGLATAMEGVTTVSSDSADEQDRYRRIAEQSGIAIGKAADGALVLGDNQKDVNNAVKAMNTALDKAKTGFEDAAAGADATSGAAGDISGNLDNAAGGADSIADAFTKTDKSAPLVQGSRDFAGWMSAAKDYAESIRGFNLDTLMQNVRDRTQEAAGAAKTFYDWLAKAAALPGSRWTGGPVEAGESYRINELGQEAFLSAGRLSLINAPQNAIWRAPSSGVVIPAGITARLQETGAIPGIGGIASHTGTAELAIEIGKLRQEVGELARRQWNINVSHRTGPTGSQVLRTLQQLR